MPCRFSVSRNPTPPQVVLTSTAPLTCTWLCRHLQTADEDLAGYETSEGNIELICSGGGLGSSTTTGLGPSCRRGLKAGDRPGGDRRLQCLATICMIIVEYCLVAMTSINPDFPA